MTASQIGPQVSPATQGVSGFRLRLFVNPNDSDVQVNDIDYTVRMAQRVRAAGAKLLLDLHYSDTWADPGHQDPPAAWAALGIDSLERQVESYSADVIARLKQAGALPDVVQVPDVVMPEPGGQDVESPRSRAGSPIRSPASWCARSSASSAGPRWYSGVIS